MKNIFLLILNREIGHQNLKYLQLYTDISRKKTAKYCSISYIKIGPSSLLHLTVCTRSI